MSCPHWEDSNLLLVSLFASMVYPERQGSWRPFHVGCSVCRSSISTSARSSLNLATLGCAGYLVESLRIVLASKAPFGAVGGGGGHRLNCCCVNHSLGI